MFTAENQPSRKERKRGREQEEGAREPGSQGGNRS